MTKAYSVAVSIWCGERERHRECVEVLMGGLGYLGSVGGNSTDVFLVLDVLDGQDGARFRDQPISLPDTRVKYKYDCGWNRKEFLQLQVSIRSGFRNWDALELPNCLKGSYAGVSYLP